MKLEGKRIFVTGGAGFIGSELCAKLLEKGNEVTCFDNFSSGNEEFIAGIRSNPKFAVVKGDMLKVRELRNALRNCETVIHLAANPDVRLGQSDTNVHFEQNVVATYNLLEAMKSQKKMRLPIWNLSKSLSGRTSLASSRHTGRTRTTRFMRRMMMVI